MNNQRSESALIRQEKRRYRQSLSSILIFQASAKARDRLRQCQEFEDARTVAIYYPTQGELDPLPLLEVYREKIFALPVIVAEPHKHLDFYRYGKEDKMRLNQYGIQEPLPLPEKKIALASIDVILVPMVAFDKAGNRMGSGAGYYDRTLVFHKKTSKPVLIGFAYDWQKVNELAIQPWDVSMNFVVTDARVYR